MKEKGGEKKKMIIIKLVGYGEPLSKDVIAMRKRLSEEINKYSHIDKDGIRIMVVPFGVESIDGQSQPFIEFLYTFWPKPRNVYLAVKSLGENVITIEGTQLK